MFIIFYDDIIFHVILWDLFTPCIFPIVNDTLKYYYLLSSTESKAHCYSEGWTRQLETG